MKKAKTKNERKGAILKICNVCGEDCFVYTIDKNAIICSDCKPTEKTKKTITNENQMLQTILKIKGEKNGSSK